MPDDPGQLEKLHKELHETFNEFKSLNQARKEEIDKHGAETALTKEQVEKANARMDELETRLATLNTSSGDAKESNREELDAFLRKGQLFDRHEARAVEVHSSKALDLATDASAGVLQDDAYLNEIQKTVVEFSPMRRFARTININTTAIDIPKRTQTAAAAWIGETATRTETQNPNYELVNVPAIELYARADVSNQLLEDSEFNLESELAMEFGEQFGVTEGTAFVKGTGSTQPLGILDDTDGIDSVAANEDTAKTLQPEDLFDLFYSVKSPYATRGVWMLNRSTLPLIRGFETTAGNYIWAPGLSPSDPATLLGRPYVEATDIDAPQADGTFANSTKPLMFGDYRRAYVIVNRVAVSVQRDPFSLAASGQVRYIARKRTGGKPMITEAAAYLQMSAS